MYKESECFLLYQNGALVSMYLHMLASEIAALKMRLNFVGTASKPINDFP
jgi:hypothetical protein